ncbi:hypothetical protein Clacol_009730 [Clathrus columnatus]|uniref:Uncharacterized protein n=1 Tax=Clathrus columnatus TaxID=1419009 RepID=A0AAV5ALA4_9AGAM|nr:hypothetical protein Clacol_009730 [Clathrus columnatus]
MDIDGADDNNNLPSSTMDIDVAKKPTSAVSHVGSLPNGDITMDNQFSRIRTTENHNRLPLSIHEHEGAVMRMELADSSRSASPESNWEDDKGPVGRTDKTKYDSPYPIPKDSDFPPILYLTQPSYHPFQTELRLYIDLGEKLDIRISPTTAWPAPTPTKTYHKDLEDLEIIETLHYARPIIIQGFQGTFVIGNSYSLKKRCPYTPVGITRVIAHQNMDLNSFTLPLMFLYGILDL